MIGKILDYWFPCIQIPFLFVVALLEMGGGMGGKEGLRYRERKKAMIPKQYVHNMNNCKMDLLDFVSGVFVAFSKLL